MSALRRACAALLATALALTVATTVASPASAAPPVTVDDEVSVYPGQARLVDVLGNDSDPDGDDLAVCRLADPGEHDTYYVDITAGRIFIATSAESADPITITYYACDYETLVPATLTVSFKEIKPITVVKLDRPGRLKITNDNDARVRFLYGDFDERRPDGHVGIAPHDSAVVRVHRHTIDWVAILARSVLAGTGHVRHIQLPAGDPGPARARVTLDRVDARAWAAGR